MIENDTFILSLLVDMMNQKKKKNHCEYTMVWSSLTDKKVIKT